MSTVDARALVPSGVEIAQAVFMEESQPADLSFFGRRYLQSGNVEVDISKFDPLIFTAVGIFNFVSQTSGFDITDGNIEGISSDGTQFVAVGRKTAGAGHIATSIDGAAWIERTSHTFTQNIKGVSFGASVFVAVGLAGIIQTSIDDGVTWIDRTNTFGTTIEGVFFGSGVFVAYGGAGGAKIETSTDGETWISRSPDSWGSFDAESGTFGSGIHLVGGENGNLNTSDDGGVTWITRVSSFGSTTINGLAFGNSVYVAVGQSGKIATSSDATNWTQQTGAHSTNNILQITFANGLFIAVGQSGQWQSSKNGEEWFAETNPSSGSQRTVHFDSVLNGAAGGDDADLTTFDVANFAGNRTSFSEFGENQYVRIE